MNLTKYHQRTWFFKPVISLLFIFPLIFSININAQSLHIAVASNFIAPMKNIIKKFEQQSGYRVKASYGSSGKLYAQISHGAPFDLFFSADQTKPQRLIQQELASASSRFTYAVGALVLWSNNTKFNHLNEKTLAQHNVKRLAFANPKLAPYGAAAIDVLKHLKLMKQTEKKWLQGENISQVYQFVNTGNADLGFVALSQVLNQSTLFKQYKNNHYWRIPQHLYQPIKQDVVLLTQSKNKLAGKEFLTFIQSKEIQTLIHSSGYQRLPLQNKTQF